MTKATRGVLTTIYIATVVVGCQSSPGAGSVPLQQPGVAQTASVPASQASQDSITTHDELTQTSIGATGCNHVLWPIQDRAVWVYQMVRPQGTSELTMTADASISGMVLRLGNQSRSLNCLDGSYSGLPPFPLGHPDLGSTIGGGNTGGTYLPSPDQLMPLGTATTWDMQFDATGIVNLPSNDGHSAFPITGGRIALIHSTLALESLTVPAGQYTVLPVHEDALFDLKVGNPDGRVQTITISCASEIDFAEGVGPVRIIYQGGTISTPEDTWTLSSGIQLQLTSHSAP